ncbi:MAG: hypothetical protein WC532_05525 [Candidatus Omnitrophota bacterium]
MRSRQYSGNSAKRGLLFNASLALIIFFLPGCSTSTAPTFLKENIPEAIVDISKKEYGIDLKARLVGETVWVYFPVENIFEKADKPEKYSEKFLIKESSAQFKDGRLEIGYFIRPIPDTEKTQEFKYNKKILEKINDIISVTRRVMFSAEREKKREPKFICIVIADIKTGIEIRELSYYLDLKKVSYNYISLGEYQHRTIQDVSFLPEAVGDKDGLYISYTDIPMGEFISKQIQHRIRLKFQKPEVDKHADIDKEIIKIAAVTLKAYGIKNFEEVRLTNQETSKKVTLNEAAIWARTTD